MDSEKDKPPDDAQSIGRLDVKNLVLCTAGPAVSLSRYAAKRLSAELPNVNVHVFYQDPSAAKSEQTLRLLSISYWKKKYWGFLADCRNLEWAYFKHFFLNRWQRKINRLLARTSPASGQPASENHVASVNAHIHEITKCNPDVILIFGGRKVSAEVLASAPLALNIHCGKLPMYRGVKSAFFALAEGRPDQVGVTLHEATPELDAGRIIHWRQVHPSSAASIPELLFTLTQTGVDLAIETIKDLQHGSIPTESQIGTPRMFRMKDFDQDIIRKARRNFRLLTKHSDSDTLPSEALA